MNEQINLLSVPVTICRMQVSLKESVCILTMVTLVSDRSKKVCNENIVEVHTGCRTNNRENVLGSEPFLML